MEQLANNGQEYVWSCYWGGATRSDKPPMIHDKIRELRLAVGGLAAKRQKDGPMFPVKSAKDLANKLGQALCDLNLVAPVVAQEVSLIETDKIPGNVTNSGKPVFRTLAHVKATVRIGAEDGSFVDMVGSGHGGDTDDKAGGKATTYAWKDAILKGLTTPEQDMIDTDDEAPSEAAERPGPTKMQSKPGKVDPPVNLPAPPAPGEDSEGLAYVLTKIDKATSVAELEAIAAAIKAGTLALAGADKLRASTAYVARKKVLEGK